MQIRGFKQQQSHYHPSMMQALHNMAENIAVGSAINA